MKVVDTLLDQVLDRLQGIRIVPKTILCIYPENFLDDKLQEFYPEASITRISIQQLKQETRSYDLVMSIGDVTFAEEPLELLLAMLKLVVNDRGLLMLAAFGIGTEGDHGQKLWEGLQDIHNWGDAMTRNDWGHPVLDVLSVDIQSPEWVKGVEKVWPMINNTTEIRLEIIFGLAWKEVKDEVGISLSEIKSSRSKK
ncbi:MAG TPA: hypothetical protein QF353_07015 [Gammaproteobacteria bacterium]|nr:hypothetical protein [Gammaproteobacteria bacterium]